MNHFNDNFRKGLTELHILKTEHCNPQQTKILREMKSKSKQLPTEFTEDPERIDEFVHLINHESTNDELLKLMLLQQAKHIRSIKNCVVFFTILGILSLLLSFSSCLL
jgi:hypothetical protein